MSVAVISSTGHVYRQQKVSAGRRTIRKQRYPIQPHDIVIYKGRKYETSECHNNGTRAILLPDKKNVAIKKLTVYCFSGGYVIQPLNERGEAGGMQAHSSPSDIHRAGYPAQIMKKKLMIFLTTTILMFSLVGCGVAGTETSNRGTISKIYNSDIYEFVDPDTGIHYLIYSHKAGSGGMGGMTPRLKSDGSVMCDNYTNEAGR